MGKRVTRVVNLAQWIDWIHHVQWTSNGRLLDMMSIGKVVQWCSMDPMGPLDPFPMFKGHVQCMLNGSI